MNLVVVDKILQEALFQYGWAFQNFIKTTYFNSRLMLKIQTLHATFILYKISLAIFFASCRYAISGFRCLCNALRNTRKSLYKSYLSLEQIARMRGSVAQW